MIYAVGSMFSNPLSTATTMEIYYVWSPISNKLENIMFRNSWSSDSLTKGDICADHRLRPRNILNLQPYPPSALSLRIQATSEDSILKSVVMDFQQLWPIIQSQSMATTVWWPLQATPKSSAPSLLATRAYHLCSPPTPLYSKMAIFQAQEYNTHDIL